MSLSLRLPLFRRLSTAHNLSTWPVGVSGRIIALLLGLLALSAAGLHAQTTWTVDTTADDSTTSSATAQTNCQSGNSGTCALRDAVLAAASGDTIQFSVTGTITLGSALPAIQLNLTIQGPGANQLTISGANSYLVFSVSGGDVTLSGLTVANGSNANTGGLWDNSNGTVVVNRCAFVNNTATGGLNAGAITFGGSGTLDVENSTFTGNSDTTYGASGAVTSSSSTNTLNVVNSTFYNNNGPFGGGVGNFGGPMNVINNTFYNNSGSVAETIYASGTSTVANNVFANNGPGPVGFSANEAQTTVAGNVYWNNAGGDCFNCTLPGVAVNGVGGIDAASDPLTLPLGYYGGPTQTYLPQPGSAAICAGSASPASAASLSTDQRGFTLTSNFCANGGVDAGAVQTNYIEVRSSGGALSAGSIFDCPGTKCTLTDAVLIANSAASPNVYGDIDFASSVSSITQAASLTLSSTYGVNIIGPGANQLTVNGGGSGSNFSVFTVNSGAAATLYGLTIADGAATLGGGVDNEGTLSLANSQMTGNNGSPGGGGAIHNASSGTLMVTDSTLNGNSAEYIGAGIYNEGTATFVYSTLYGNNAGAFGGGITNSGTMTLWGVTIAGNTASEEADIDDFGGTLYSYNSLDVGNGAPPVSPAGLSPLQYNGIGATVETAIPLPGSAAICAGTTTNVPSGTTTDERGYPLQPSGGYCATGTVDAGAVQTNYTALSFLQQPSDVAVSATMSPAPTIQVVETDTLLSSSNTDAVNVTGLTVTSTGPSPNFTLTDKSSELGTGYTESTSSGSVELDGLNFSAAASSDTLTGTLTVTGTTTITGTSNSFNVIGPPQLVVSAPSTATAGSPFSVTLTAEDSANNVVTSYAGTVTVTIHSGPSGASFDPSSTLTAICSSGVCTFSNLTLDTAGAYTISATDTTNSSLTVQFALTNTAGNPAQITASSGTPQSANLNSLFTNSLVATVVDLYNNPVPFATVTFTAPSSGASGTFSNSNSTITGTTNSSGQIAEPFTANTIAGSYSVTAATAGVKLNASFSLTNVLTAAIITSPGNNFTLPGTTESFNWSSVDGATGYVLHLGTTKGGNDIHGTGLTTANNVTFSELPANGRTIYARLYTFVGSSYAFKDYTFTAASAATLTSPAPGAVLTDLSASFQWTAGTGVGYVLHLGTTPGANDIHGTGSTTATSVTFSSLPANGHTIYARLYTFFDSGYSYTDYTFTAASQAVIGSPTASSTLTSGPVTFNWNTVAGATAYVLHLGTTPGGNDIHGSGVTTNNSVRFNSLPTGGHTIYARLYTYFPSGARYVDSTYTEAP